MSKPKLSAKNKSIKLKEPETIKPIEDDVISNDEQTLNIPLNEDLNEVESDPTQINDKVDEIQMEEIQLDIDDENIQDDEDENDQTDQDQSPNQENAQTSDFMPTPPDYIIRQQQIATYQILCEVLMHNNKNVTETLNDVRVSIDCLTKCMMKLNKTFETFVEKK